MRIGIILVCFLVSSCSLLYKRKGHYSYLKQGISIEEVEAKSGDAISESFSDDYHFLVYDYCKAPYWKEALFGIATFGLYLTSCDESYYKMRLIFKNGDLVEVQDDINPHERAMASQRRARAAQGMANEYNRQNERRRQNLPKKPTEFTCKKTGYNSTTCKESPDMTAPYRQ